MKRTLNFTGRKRINLKDISISIDYEGEKIHSVVVNELNLKDYGFPEYSKVFLEAYHRMEFERYNLGELGNLDIPKKYVINEQLSRETLRFRLIIVDPLTKTILGSAESVKPTEELQEHKKIKSLLKVETLDLGEKVWEISFENLAVNVPILRLNEKISEIKYRIRNDPIFFCLILPAALREILTYIVLIEGVDPAYLEKNEFEEEDWKIYWLKFAEKLQGEIPDFIFKENNEVADKLEWIEKVVDAFCYEYSSMFFSLQKNI